MISTTLKFGTSLMLMASILGMPFQAFGQGRLQYPDMSTAQGEGSKNAGPTAKLSPDLRALFNQFAGGGSKGGGSAADFAFSESELKEFYGISDSSGESMVAIAVASNGAADIAALKEGGMKVYMVVGNTVYGEAPVTSLATIAGERSVANIASTKSVKSPALPKSSAPELVPDMTAGSAKGGARATNAPLANEFNKSAMTGKGVIVGVIDSGIDWKHPDFIKPDGTTRILAIWDLYDESFKTSDGRIGTSPPKIDPNGQPLYGTIYTADQINAALKGTGTVNTMDNQGHGTAVAGTAAGNGRASAGTHTGVAPEADLIVVKASDCGSFSSGWVYGAAWMTDLAKALGKPLVVNGSFGGHFNTHDGTEPAEKFLNAISGKGKPGVVYTIAAGNEGRSSMHATGRFGPKRPGQADVNSRPISVTISPERTRLSNDRSLLLGVFDSRDDWGVAIVPSANSPLKDKTGKPMTFFLIKSEGQVKWAPGKDLVQPDGFVEYMNSILRTASVGTSTDVVSIPLPAGSYDIFGISTTDRVASGEFSMYAPIDYQVDFGRGTTKSGMVGSPGNAANVITVGAYNFRPSWTNMLNTQTYFNLPIGKISDYSSPGGKRRDGVVKPDIAAPASYTISALSQAAGPKSTTCDGGSMGADAGESFVTPDGKYIAWQGTSASTPFTAGVVALMLQKNPTMDADQVKQILIKTAGKGGDVGGVPNADWGYGMLDPAAAIRAVTAPGAARTR